MSQSHFQKFVPKKKNSLIKEEFKQAKKKAKKERAAAIDRRYEEKRQLKAAAGHAASHAPVNSGPCFRNPERPGQVLQSRENLGISRTTDKIKAIETNFNQVKKKEVIKKENAIASVTTSTKPARPSTSVTAEMPLNKFLAHCGVCSRRDAVSLIKEGKVKVNNETIKEPAHRVTERDDVQFNGKKLFISKNLVYILLNKPKDYITTTDDPQGRKTVLQLTKMATTERIYPVGRLDRNTSGVLLLTNDGELTQKLSHPGYNIAKVYEARLDKPLTKHDFDKILNGIKLEDGEIKADSLAYADAKDKSVIGIEIHSGRNRIVRRIFEHLGYDVKGLDRVLYATLTKKNVERGKWRFLSEKEIRLLKYLNASHKKDQPKEKPTTNNK
ncbi:MAG: pseudouridine synthase [Ferruginibacter sp.]